MDHRVMVFETDRELEQRIVALLVNAGYEVSSQYAGGMQAILAFQPDVVIFGADPPKLDCCDLLAEIKNSEQTKGIRVILLAPGGPGERSRGLDLGADDVLSLPFESMELLARVRAQLRDKQPQDELRERVRLAEQSRENTHEVVEAVNQGRRTLRLSLVLALSVVAVAVVVTLLFYRRTQKETTRVYAAITKLQAGVASEQELIERSRRARVASDQKPPQPPRPEVAELEKQKQRLRSRLANADPAELANLKQQLGKAEGRLQKLEAEGKVAQNIIQSSTHSICLLRVVVGFREHASGSRLRYASVNAKGEPETDSSGNPLMSLDGTGPEVQIDGFGTGFLASSRGQILTNHHVVEPWWQNDEIGEMLKQGLEPVVAEMSAYFPGIAHSIPVTVDRISSEADIAVVKGNFANLNIKPLTLDDRPESAVSGRPVVLLGYPTALDAILARAGEDTVRDIVASSKDEKQFLGELARRNLIRPISTQGHIGDVLRDKLIYDAQTTSGGSGGPLFNADGNVIGINFAVLRQFGGSNFAIPARYATSVVAH